MPRISIDLPPWIDAALAALRARGARTWLVGGTVRDALLGRPVADFDAATDLGPDAVAGALPGSRDRDVGLGAVELVADGVALTVTTLRIEADYGADRRPRRVAFVDAPERDAPRRDFTINGLYVAVPGDRVFDPVGGLTDLGERRLRMIGRAAERLAEDPLRALRAVRFAAVLGFAPDAELRAALGATATGVATLRGPRQGAEILAALRDAADGPARARLLTLLDAHGLSAAVFGPDATRVAAAVAPLARHRGDLAGAVALLCGAECRGRAERILDRFAPPAALRREVIALGRAVAAWDNGDDRGVVQALRTDRAPGFQAILAATGRVAEPGPRERLERLGRVASDAMRDWIRATDLRGLGVADGPELGRLLQTARDRAARAGVRDRADALRILRATVDEAVKPGGPADDRRP